MCPLYQHAAEEEDTDDHREDIVGHTEDQDRYDGGFEWYREAGKDRRHRALHDPESAGDEGYQGQNDADGEPDNHEAHRNGVVDGDECAPENEQRGDPIG